MKQFTVYQPSGIPTPNQILSFEAPQTILLVAQQWSMLNKIVQVVKVNSSSKTILCHIENQWLEWKRLEQILWMQAFISQNLRCHAVQSGMTGHDWTDQKTSVFRAFAMRSAIDRSRPALCPGGRETSGGLGNEWLPGNKVKIMEQVKNQPTINWSSFYNFQMYQKSEVIIHCVILIRRTFRWYISCSLFKVNPSSQHGFHKNLQRSETSAFCRWGRHSFWSTSDGMAWTALSTPPRECMSNRVRYSERSIGLQLSGSGKWGRHT